MVRKFSISLGLAALLATSAAAVPSAHANMVFRNTTDRALRFEITCNDGRVDLWTVAPYGYRSLYCNNGSPVARVRIRTNHGDDVMVVRTTVYDGLSYVLGYDRDGDVNIWRG
jgi:hypothetical protein